MEIKTQPARKTPKFMPSVYGNTPDMRGYELPDIVSVNVRDLFPDITEAIYLDDNDDISLIERLTEEALENVDMSKIKPGSSVNILSAEHGYLLFGGKPYIAMMKKIKEIVMERTGCIDIRLRVVMYRTPREGQEVVEYYNLREEFDDNVEYVSCYDKAVPIETKIGTFYGLEKAYDADYFIYAYYDDPREIYAHRLYRKSFKAFTMNLARYETRTIFHHAMGDTVIATASKLAIPTSIFDSDFVQSKYTFSCFMRSSPAGLTGIVADNDLYALDDAIVRDSLKNYAYVYHLYRSMQKSILLVDGSRWGYYAHGGGIMSGLLMMGCMDFLDLDERLFQRPARMAADSLGAFIFNQCWVGLGMVYAAYSAPCYFVGEELGEMFKNDPTNKLMFTVPTTKITKSLPEALELAEEATGTDRLLIFDGSYGFVNCSKSMAEELYRLAPEIKEKVDNELLPKYLKQRGLEVE